MPLEISSRSSKSRSGSLGSTSFALDPNAKFMSPRPAPEPRSHSPAASSIRRGRTVDVADVSVEPSTSTFTRLLNKASMSEGLRSRSGSPSRTANLRSVMSLSNLKAAQLHNDHSEDTRERKRLFQRLQKSGDRSREISRPLPRNRSAISDTARSAMSSRATSRATSRSASPAPSLQVASFRSHAAVEAAEYSPLRTYLADRSWENSPMPPRSVGDFPDPLPPAHASTSRSISQEPLSLPSQVEEGRSIDIPHEIIKEAEAVDDDFNFRFEFQPVPSGSSSSSGLSAPPSRSLAGMSVIASEAYETPLPQAMTYTSPTFGSSPHFASLPTSLRLHEAPLPPPPPPARMAPSPPDDEEENFPKSHFSMWSNSSLAMSPKSDFSDSPGSPCFSSLASVSSAPLSPAFSLIHDPQSEARPAEPSEFARTSFRSRTTIDSQTNEETVEGDTHPTDWPLKDSGPTPRSKSSAFPGYSLPEESYTSQDTIRTPVADSPAEGQTVHQSVSKERKSRDMWKEHVSAMDDMMQDLGYLGELIVSK